MTTIDEISKAVSEWATANKDALPEYACPVAGGPLPDGTVAGVTFTPDTYFWSERVEQRRMLVYRLQRDGVFAANPMSVDSARDDAYVRSVHTRTERDLERMKRRHA
jgi:hypothetical protein